MATDTKITDIWKRADGTTCVVSRRDNVFYISVERNGTVFKQRPVESPVDALNIAQAWERSLNDVELGGLNDPSQ